MKAFSLTTIFAVSLFLCTNGLWAQTEQTKLNQVELMKQFIGTWESVGNDTTYIWECKLLGSAMEFTIKTEIKGKTTIDAKTLMGYDNNNNRLVEAVIGNNSSDISLCPCWFTTKNSLTQILWKDIADPENADLKWIVEFKTPDSFVITEIRNKKMREPYTYIRAKL